MQLPRQEWDCLTASSFLAPGRMRTCPPCLPRRPVGHKTPLPYFEGLHPRRAQQIHLENHLRQMENLQEILPGNLEHLHHHCLGSLGAPLDHTWHASEDLAGYHMPLAPLEIFSLHYHLPTNFHTKSGCQLVAGFRMLVYGPCRVVQTVARLTVGPCSWLTSWCTVWNGLETTVQGYECLLAVNR